MAEIKITMSQSGNGTQIGCLEKPETQTVTEIIDKVKAEICDYYCKWPHSDRYCIPEGYDRMLEEQCDKCPLNRL